MKTITYTNNQGLELKINKFASGAFSLTFNNGAHTFCDTMTELRTILLKNGMTRKWAANVKDRFDPLTEEHVLINRYRTPGVPTFFSFFTSKNFSYVCDTNKRIRQWQLQVTSTAMV